MPAPQQVEGPCLDLANGKGIGVEGERSWTPSGGQVTSIFQENAEFFRSPAKASMDRRVWIWLCASHVLFSSFLPRLRAACQSAQLTKPNQKMQIDICPQWCKDLLQAQRCNLDVCQPIPSQTNKWWHTKKNWSNWSTSFSFQLSQLSIPVHHPDSVILGELHESEEVLEFYTKKSQKDNQPNPNFSKK